MGFWNGVKDFLVGGNATNGIDTKPAQYDAATNQLGQMAAGAQGRAGPQIGGTQLATGQMDQSRAGVMGVAGRLGAIASGQTAGAGEIAVNRQVGQATAAQTAAARMARGANSALAYRNAARNTADVGLAGAGQAAQAQMADQQAANAQLGSLYGGLYGQDAQVAAQNAGLGQAAQIANQGATLSQRQMNDARQIQALGQQLGWDQARIQAEIQKAQIAAQDKGILPGLIQGAGQAAAAYATGGLSMAGGMGGGGGGQNPAHLMDTGGLMVPSDERLKTGIRDASGDAAAAVRGVRPIAFQYTDPALGAGYQLGLSAQDLQRNPGLAHTVIDTPAGKQVHGGKLAAAAMAALPGIDERVAALEAMTPAGARAMPRIAEGRRLAASVPVPLPPAAIDAAAQAAQAEMMRRRALLGAIPASAAGGYYYSPDSGGGYGAIDAGGQ
jgi:hypothetical protein